MSEVESKTAGGIETSQNENPSLLKRARGVLDNSAFGKFIGGAMIVGAIAGATRDAAAETVGESIICSTQSYPLEGPYIILDRLNQGIDKDNYVQATGATSGDIDTRGEDIYRFKGTGIDRYNRNLEYLSKITAENGVRFIEGCDVLYSLGKFYKVNELKNGLTKIGELQMTSKPSVDQMVSDGQHIFIVIGVDQSPTAKLMISRISIDPSDSENPSFAEIDDIMYGSQGKPFVDEIRGGIMVPYQQSTGKYGYRVITYNPTLNLGNFQEVDETHNRRIERGRVASDGIYMLTKEDPEDAEAEIIIYDFYGDYNHSHTVYPNSDFTSDPMKKLPNGGVVLTEINSRYHTIIKQGVIKRGPAEGDPVDSLLEDPRIAPNLNITECAVLSDLCEDIDPDDGNVCTIDECDSVTGETIHTQITSEECSEGIPDTSEEVGDEIPDTSEEVGDEIPDTSEEVGEEVPDTSEEVGDEIPDTSEEVGDEIPDTSEEVGEEVPDTSEEVLKDGAEDPGQRDSDPGTDPDPNTTLDVIQTDDNNPHNPDAFAEGDEDERGNGCSTNGKGSPEGMIPVAALGMAILMRKRLEEWWKSVTKQTANTRD